MRQELIHPMIIGFPICFFFTGLFLRIIALGKSDSKIYFLNASWISFSIGILMGMLAIFTGQLASEIVEPYLCDPDILKYHQFFAITTLTVITCGLLTDFQKKIHPAFGYLGIGFYLLAAILMVITGALGGNLVFEQGAAVQKICTKPD